MMASDREITADSTASGTAGGVRPTGHVQIKGTRGARAFYALWRDADGRHQRKLGPAWVKDSVGAPPAAPCVGAPATAASRRGI